MTEKYNNNMKVKIKKMHPNAVIPKYAKEGDAGMDLTAVSREIDSDGNICYDIGLAFEIPQGYAGLVFPRSSNAKNDFLLSNSIGLIDSGFRGSVSLKFKPLMEAKDSEFLEVYEVGDRIGQIVILPYPQIEFEEVEALSESERGIGGYGSTGK